MKALMQKNLALSWFGHQRCDYHFLVLTNAHWFTSCKDQEMNNRLNWKASNHLNQLLLSLVTAVLKLTTSRVRLWHFILHKVIFGWCWTNVWLLWEWSSCVYSLSLGTQGTLVGVGVSIAATHRRHVQRARHDLLCVRTGRLPENNNKKTHRTWCHLPSFISS